MARGKGYKGEWQAAELVSRLQLAGSGLAGGGEGSQSNLAKNQYAPCAASFAALLCAHNLNTL